MTESETGGFDFDQRPESPHANQFVCELVADRVDHDHRPDEVVISPLETEPGVFTTWITADADDLVDLAEVR